jgi:CHAD domain-containing protein
MTEAQRAWHLANLRERSHAKTCRRLRAGKSCYACLHWEAAQNVAAERVHQLRIAARAAGPEAPMASTQRESRPV